MKFLLRKSAFTTAAAAFCCLPCGAQAKSQTPAFRINSPLTLVDVIAEQAGTGGGPELVTTLHRGDFRIFDDGREMPIQSFDVGVEGATRPIALWLIVQCNQSYGRMTPNSAVMPGYHSMFLRGKVHLLEPALNHLNTEDTIGVAHWCSNGDTSVDMMPIHDSEAALAKVEEILNRKPVSGGG